MTLRPARKTLIQMSRKQPAKMLDARDSLSLHHAILTLDAHLDTPVLFHQPDYEFSERGSVSADGTYVDLPRMIEGGLDGGFWAIFTPQGPLTTAGFHDARLTAMLRQMSIREMSSKYANAVELAFSADDAFRIHSLGKIVVFQSMENAYPLGEDISLLEAFYAGGLRMLGLVHARNNQFADSSTDSEALHRGLSPLGVKLIEEANRLGIILDASHASDAALRDMIEVSQTPIVLSHSSSSTVFEHPRNISDELISKVARNGGVIHINALGEYLENLVQSQTRRTAIARLNANRKAMHGSQGNQTYRHARRFIDEQIPPSRSSFEKYMEHLLYVLDLVGPEHVGIGADWDGGGGVEGMGDVASVSKITEALTRAGYLKDDIAKIWGGNTMRVMQCVEAASSPAVNGAAIVT